MKPSLTRTPYLLSWVTLGGFFSISTTRTLKHRALLAQVKVYLIQGLALTDTRAGKFFIVSLPSTV